MNIFYYETQLRVKMHIVNTLCIIFYKSDAPDNWPSRPRKVRKDEIKNEFRLFI